MTATSSTEPLIYMAGYNTVDAYTFQGQRVLKLEGFDQGVEGLCSDKNGNLWITYGASLLEYAHGGSVPIAQLYTPSAAYACAVDPSTGDIAVSLGSRVAVYTGVSSSPHVYWPSNLTYCAYLTYDDDSDLFVDGREKRNETHLAEVPNGGTKLEPIVLAQKIERLGGLAWDGQYVAIGDSLAHVVYQLSVASGTATVVTTTHFKGWFGDHFKDIEPFAMNDGLIVITISTRQTALYQFPAGGRSTLRMNVVTAAKAISVPPTSARSGQL